MTQKQLKAMMDVYMDMAIEENGVSFAKEGFAQIYEEVNKGLVDSAVKGIGFGMMASGIITLAVTGYVVYTNR